MNKLLIVILVLVLIAAIFTVYLINKNMYKPIGPGGEQPLVGGCAGVQNIYLNECCENWANENNIVKAQCIGNWTIENNKCTWICA